MYIEKDNLLDIDYKRIAYTQRENFISTIKHDLKIPILAQIRVLELLIEEKLGGLNSNQKELVNLTLDSCRSVYEMLSKILSTYKYENKDIVLDYENINILKFIEEYFNSSNDTVKQKNLKIILKNNSFYPIIFGDKFQLKKAFNNLANFCISNASKNSRFTCSINDFDDYIHISLDFASPYFINDYYKNDSGKISAERMDKVGSTLGVYLAKQIIEAHNGTIKTNNFGSIRTCEIILPLINVKSMT